MTLIPPPHPLMQTFSIPEINERPNGSPTAFFDTVRQKIFEGNLDTSPPPRYPYNFSIPEIL